MATKTINQKPRITDTILFEIKTPDVSGNYSVDPWKVNNVKIYFLERDFTSPNFGEFETYHDNVQAEAALLKAETAYRHTPNDRTLTALEEARIALEAKRTANTFYYKDSVNIHTVGDALYPAWLSSDTDNAFLNHITTDADDFPLYGHFTYEWRPQGSIREGDYIVCWTWMPNPSGSTLSAHEFFHVEANPSEVITTPAHLTKDGKYETLLERYLPEVYKSQLTEEDMTPLVTKQLNEAVAEGFTFLEDMANQIVDLFDANALHESMLMYLSNLFNLRLRSQDPTLWRRQIKEAVSLFKKKGTLVGLRQVFSQSGMLLNKYTQYWQVVSPYTWQESFLVSDSNVFTLEKIVIEPIDPNNFGVWLRRAGEETYEQVSNDSVEFSTNYGFDMTMTWVGDDLYEGDIVRVLYQYRMIPNSTAQTHENYIKNLPLADLRDEGDFVYPPKNWNVRLISEEDPMFSVLIPVRHPFADPLIFGHIRTEFAYSENIYNMDEYNGSIRPSLDVCHIDPDFTDPCGACLSSMYSVDVGVENLTNDRMLEVQDILKEYMPFHAQIHTINFTGEVVEFIPSPVEELEILVMMHHVESVLSGMVNSSFHRAMEDGLSNWRINRDDLADKNTVYSEGTATGYNNEAVFVAIDHRLNGLGVIPYSNYLEILPPAVNAGGYNVSTVVGNTARIESDVTEPLDESLFTFNLSNVLYKNTVAIIEQNDLFTFTDPTIDFATEGVKTEWDLVNTPSYTGDAWSILIPDYSETPYTIEDIRNGTLYLAGDNQLPTTTTSLIAYSLLNGQGVTVATSTSGILTVERRAKVDLKSPNLEIDLYVKVGDYLVYEGEEFKITTIEGLDVYISGWSYGDVGGAHIETRRRLIENGYGHFGYRGMYIVTTTDHEADLEVVNGTHPPSDILDDSHFKENFVIKIGDDYYRVTEWNGTTIKISGKYQNWPRTGSSINYDIIHFEKKAVNVRWLVFDHLDRDGHDVIVREVYDDVTRNVAIVALESGNSSGIQENVSQEESISFVIERQNGSTEKGEIC